MAGPAVVIHNGDDANEMAVRHVENAKRKASDNLAPDRIA
jgi:hypothetical protein